MTDETYFITGSNGFVGSALARELNRRGKKLVLLLHAADDHPVLRSIKAKRIWGNVLKAETYRDYLNDQVCVFHCAAVVSFFSKDRRIIWETNYEGTRILLKACLEKKVKSFLFLSAGAVWRARKSFSDLITEDSPVNAIGSNPYGSSKVAAEEACLEAYQQGLNVIILNPTTVYGEGDFHLRAGGKVVKKVYEHGLGLIPSGGTSWIDIQDLITGILLALEQGRPGEKYIISAGNISYRELFLLIAQEYGLKGQSLVIPAFLKVPCVIASWILKQGGNFIGQPAEISPFQILESFQYKYFSFGKAQQQLGFKPIISLVQSLKKTIEFNQRYELLK